MLIKKFAFDRKPKQQQLNQQKQQQQPEPLQSVVGKLCKFNYEASGIVHVDRVCVGCEVERNKIVVAVNSLGKVYQLVEDKNFHHHMHMYIRVDMHVCLPQK